MANEDDVGAWYEAKRREAQALRDAIVIMVQTRSPGTERDKALAVLVRRLESTLNVGD